MVGDAPSDLAIKTLKFLISIFYGFFISTKTDTLTGPGYKAEMF